MYCSESEPDWWWLHHLKTTAIEKTGELLATYNFRVTFTESFTNGLKAIASQTILIICSGIQSQGDKSSHNNTLLKSRFYSLMVGAARTSCSGWMVQDSDCLCNASEAWGRKRHSAFKKSQMQWKQCFHLIQLKRHQINQHSFITRNH